jgi:type IV pilus assembly protein PilE
MVNKIKHLGRRSPAGNPFLPAFTLSELLVVLVIIGILVLLALPRFMPLISKTRSVEAQQALKFVHTLERSYFFEYARYSKDLNAIHFEQEKLATDEGGGSANYYVEIVEASPSSFVARATAVVDFDGDGEFNVWEINEGGELTEVKND